MAPRLDRHVIGHLLAGAEVDAWGVAGNQPPLPLAPALPLAISLMMRLDPEVVRGIADGPTPAYADEYRRLNDLLDQAAQTLAQTIKRHGYAAEAVPATVTDARADKLRFSHKSAATQAGLGWIGKTGLFVSERFGPAVRLATVFTDLPLTAGRPVRSSRCGTCAACVKACPAAAGRDVTWTAGMSRDQVIDVGACQRHLGAAPQEALRHLCGICIAACPRSHASGRSSEL